MIGGHCIFKIPWRVFSKHLWADSKDNLLLLRARDWCGAVAGIWGHRDELIVVVSLTDTLRYPLPLLFLRLFFFSNTLSTVSCCCTEALSSCQHVLAARFVFPEDVPYVWSLLLEAHGACSPRDSLADNILPPPMHLTSSICLQRKYMSSCSCPS